MMAVSFNDAKQMIDSSILFGQEDPVTEFKEYFGVIPEDEFVSVDTDGDGTVEQIPEGDVGGTNATTESDVPTLTLNQIGGILGDSALRLMPGGSTLSLIGRNADGYELAQDATQPVIDETADGFNSWVEKHRNTFLNNVDAAKQDIADAITPFDGQGWSPFGDMDLPKLAVTAVLTFTGILAALVILRVVLSEVLESVLSG